MRHSWGGTVSGHTFKAYGVPFEHGTHTGPPDPCSKPSGFPGTAHLLCDGLFRYSTFLLTVELGTLVSGWETRAYKNGCRNFPATYLNTEFRVFFRRREHTGAALLDEVQVVAGGRAEGQSASPALIGLMRCVHPMSALEFPVYEASPGKPCSRLPRCQALMHLERPQCMSLCWGRAATFPHTLEIAFPNFLLSIVAFAVCSFFVDHSFLLELLEARALPMTCWHMDLIWLFLFGAQCASGMFHNNLLFCESFLLWQPWAKKCVYLYTSAGILGLLLAQKHVPCQCLSRTNCK